LLRKTNNPVSSDNYYMATACCCRKPLEFKMAAYRNLIATALKKGFTVSVWDGEEWQVKKSAKLAECVDAVKSVEEAQLRFRNSTGEIVGWALVSAYGLDSDETVIDFSGKDWIEEWENNYQICAGNR
jgi:hypothetical protein